MATLNGRREQIADAIATLLDDINDHDLPELWPVSRITVSADRDNPGGWAVRMFGGPGSQTTEHLYAAYITDDGRVIVDAS
jgi:hypothetical protein